MPMRIKTIPAAGENPDAVLIEVMPEAMEAVSLIRQLKKAFPAVFRQVHYEMDMPEKKLILNGDVEDG